MINRITLERGKWGVRPFDLEIRNRFRGRKIWRRGWISWIINSQMLNVSDNSGWPRKWREYNLERKDMSKSWRMGMNYRIRTISIDNAKHCSPTRNSISRLLRRRSSGEKRSCIGLRWRRRNWTLWNLIRKMNQRSRHRRWESSWRRPGPITLSLRCTNPT